LKGKQSKKPGEASSVHLIRKPPRLPPQKQKEDQETNETLSNIRYTEIEYT
jgi:hypothetical protein